MADLRQAFERLRSAAASGELGALCRRYGVPLLVAFGSVVRPTGTPNDVDLAAYLDRDADVLGFLDEMAELAGTSQLDLMNLALAGPVAREKALVGGVPLVEETTGTFARARLAAIMERMDTAWLRRLDLELMSR